ncbi:MAG: S1/P1 nuclease [bacterium]
MLSKIYVFITFLALVIVPLNAFPWGPNGHRIVAAIAEERLSPSAKTAVHKILGHESMPQVSNWMDLIRSDSAWDFTNSYHHVNMPEGQDYWTAEKDPEGDAVRAIIYYEDVLRDKKASKEDKGVALKIIIHVIGDIHQPLHVGTFDLSGNKRGVSWFGVKTNLHKVWDESLIDFQKLSYTEYVKFIDHIEASEAASWKKSSVIDWANESAKIRDSIYLGLEDEEGNRIYNLSYKYNYSNIDTVNSRLRQAGVRLATFLNNIFENKKNVDADMIRAKLDSKPKYGMP